MKNLIHPTAIIDPGAKLGANVEVGPYAIIDEYINAAGKVSSAHSLNPVPFIVVDDDVKAVRNGILADIAPTILKLMGIAQPEQMTGKALIDF